MTQFVCLHHAQELYDPKYCTGHQTLQDHVEIILSWTLHVCHGNISDLPFPVLTDCERIFDQSNKNYTEVPPEISACSIEVDLSSNYITQIESNDFDHLKNCTKLNLSNNTLSILEPDAFVGLDNLQQLNMEKNTISKIENTTFAQLSNLDKLNLEQNQILEIEDNSFRKTESHEGP